MRYARSSQAVALTLALTCCDRSCTYDAGEKTFESLDAAVKVELVREAHPGWGAASLFPSGTSFVLRVHTTPSFDEPIECTSVDLAEDPTATTVAYRCRTPGAAWTAIRIGRGSAHVVDCVSSLGVARKPDFAKLPPLASVAVPILDCQEKRIGLATELVRRYDALASGLRDVGGAAAVRAFLVASADRPLPSYVQDNEEDPWLVEVQKLSPQERADFESDLCGALVDPAKDEAYVRAARLCTLNDPRVGDAALARVRASLARPAPTGTAASRRRPSALEWAMPLASNARPAETADAACAWLAGSAANDPRRVLALAAVGASNTRCAAVASLTPAPCDPSLDCDAGLCTARELAPAFASWRKIGEPLGDAGARRPGPVTPNGSTSLLAATYALGPLPRELVIRNARRHYELERTTENPGCGERMNAGAPCTCEALDPDREWLCDLPLDGGRMQIDHCSLRADDRLRRVGSARHTCLESDAGACSMDDDCCIALRCDGDSGVCVAE